MDPPRLDPHSRRARFDFWVVSNLDRGQLALTRHWLAAANVAMTTLLTLPIAAPVLAANGHGTLADPIYWIYRAVCHQWPFRSFFLFGEQATYAVDDLIAGAGADELFTFVGSPLLGYKMAICERDLAIGVAALLMGILYARVRRRLAPPSIPFYLALLLPIAIDGTTQLFGWRESTWDLRVSTGAITGAATVWLLFPYLELGADRWLHAQGTRGSSATRLLSDQE